MPEFLLIGLKVSLGLLFGNILYGFLNRQPLREGIGRAHV